MKDERWRLIEHLYHAVLERGPEARAAFLVEACAGDEDLRREVEALLRYDDQAGSFIETPALELAARRMAADTPAGESAEPSSVDPIPRQIGPYNLLAPLGKGGMGEVHLALDTRLNRKVAIKLLPVEFTADSERVRRFEQEARAASALNHPNIITVHEIGRMEDRHYIVTEYIDGETLRRQMANAPEKRMRLGAALAIAAQVAGALQAAHEAGIVHRDIKPENVMVRADGLVKVLDFGLAKVSCALVDSEWPMPERVSTESGMLMGTVTYMSPEQARGEKVDHRTDIFSLGVILYEMLAGRTPFEGETTSDVLAAVLTSEPVLLGEVVPAAPAPLCRIVRRCVEKKPEKRFQSAADLAFALEEVGSLTGTAAVSHAEASAPALTLARRLSQGRLTWILAAVGAGLSVAAIILALFDWRGQPEEKLATAFTITVPSLSVSGPAVSPDGRYIVFSASHRSPQAGRGACLWIRRLDSTEAKIMPGTEAAFVDGPFWSPDSRSVAFWADRRLRRIDISGGPALTVCEGPATRPGTWNREGSILFSPADRPDRIRRVAPTGGQVTTLNPFAEGETFQTNPRFLPDGRQFLYYSRNRDPENDGIYAASLEPGSSRKLVLKNAGVAMYVAPGYLLFNRENTLMAQRFDLKQLEVVGEPVRVVEQVASAPGGVWGTPAARFSASENGVLAWQAQRSGADKGQLAWFDRSGRRLGTVGEPAVYTGPAFSPDQGRLVVARLDPRPNTRDLWIMRLANGAASRLTFDPADDFNPVWSPDGRWIIFTSGQTGPRKIYRKRADGAGEAEPLFESQERAHVEDISSDGRFLIFNSFLPDASGPGLSVLWLTKERRRTTFLATPFWEFQAQFSPNGRWVAYSSGETSALEVFVRGFESNGTASGGKWQISKNGGIQPRWRADGKELIYLEGNILMAVDVETDSSSFSSGTPRALFRVQTSPQGRNAFLVTKDGRRFLVVEPAEGSADSTIAVRTNWLAQLER
jgi:serine/threonine protein kinase/Tol biopolymer transport system component